MHREQRKMLKGFHKRFFFDCQKICQGKNTWSIQLVLSKFLKTGTIILSVLMLSNGLLLSQNSDEMESITKSILLYQQNYFQRILSIEFKSFTMLTLSKEAYQIQKLSRDTIEVEMKFVSNGLKYRSEVSFYDFSADKDTLEITAYNGTLYQKLHIRKEPILYISKHTETVNPYNNLNPLLAPFLFAFSKSVTAHLKIDPFQNPQTWLSLADKITGIGSERNMLGYQGILLKFKKSEGLGGKDIHYKVFFAKDLNYYPIYWEGINHLNQRVETRVLEVRKYNGESGEIIIPIRIEGKEYFANNKIAQISLMKIDPKTLRVNQPIKDDIFTIPVSQSNKVFDADVEIWFEPNKK
jgi:hypothetical protein